MDSGKIINIYENIFRSISLRKMSEIITILFTDQSRDTDKLRFYITAI